jgi:hypothetical protein
LKKCLGHEKTSNIYANLTADEPQSVEPLNLLRKSVQALTGKRGGHSQNQDNFEYSYNYLDKKALSGRQRHANEMRVRNRLL